MKESIFQKELMLIKQISQKMYALSLLVFLNKNFTYGPYLYDGCYNVMQKSTYFKNIAIVHVKKFYE